MRPQFHHLDALAHQDNAARRREREAAEPPRTTEPRAVQLQIKSADGENVDMTSTKNFLRIAQEEPWTKLRYHDEDVSTVFVFEFLKCHTKILSRLKHMPLIVRNFSCKILRQHLNYIHL
jgi:hypothetical protein